jgi:hypothetical protein
MKRLFRYISYFMLPIIVLTIYKCQKNPHDTPQTIDPLGEKVTATVKGRVTDENGNPVNNASVQSAGALTATDINGFFRLDNIQLAKNAGFVLVEKTGYLKGCRTIFTNAGIANNIEIQLIPKIKRGNFSAGTGGSAIIQNGSSVNFPANAIINAITNATYTGTVNVIGAYLDPADPKLSLMMPGNLTGLTANNEQKLLQTFGMIGVELEGSNGEKLNLASGKTATIIMPIPSSSLSSAPATIPLWFFDETNGLWKEEGTATKQGGNYVGNVSHFTFWNCDVPNNFVTLRLTLKNQNALPAAGYRVELRNTQNNSTAYAITDSAGVASGAVPPNVGLEMRVYTKCNNLVYLQSIGPFNAATDLGVITITTPKPASISISGTAKNCSLQPVTNGFTDVIVEGLIYRTAINNGNFSITLERCTDSTAPANIIVTDMQTNQQSSPATINVTSGTYSAGQILACGVSTAQYINFTVGGNPQNFQSPLDSFSTFRQNPSTNIQGFPVNFTDSASWQYIAFSFDGAAAPGTYTLSANSFLLTKGIYPAMGSREYSLPASITITITEYGSTGQYIAGSFSGTMHETYTNTTISGICNFRIRRGF